MPVVPIDQIQADDQQQLLEHVNDLLSPPPARDDWASTPDAGNTGAPAQTDTSGLPTPDAPVTAPLVPPQPAPLTPTSPVTAPLVAPHADIVPNQFASGLSYQDALAACGPVAAVALAKTYGNDIPVQAALDAAKAVGWTQAGGMNGVGNQKRLLEHFGIATRLDTSPSEQSIAQDAASGNPVTISTPAHYYVANDYNPQTGQFFVGKSGQAFKSGGGQWMTLAQIRAQGGGINGALFVDNPTTPTPSIAAQPRTGSGSSLVADVGAPPPSGAEIAPQATPVVSGNATDANPASDLWSHVQTLVGDTANHGITTVGSGVTALGSAKDQLAQHVADLTGGSITPVSDAAPPDASSPPSPSSSSPLDVVKQKFSDAIDAIGGLLSGAGSVMQPGMDLQRQGQVQLAEGVGNALTEPQPWMENAYAGASKATGMPIPSGTTASSQPIFTDNTDQPLTPREEGVLGRSMATGLIQIVAPEDLVARATTGGAGSLAKSAQVAQDLATSRQAAMATSGFASGADALYAARQAVADLKARFPQMSPGSLAASGAGKQLATLEADAAANPSKYAVQAPQIPNANRARAAAADRAAGGPSADVGPGSATRDARLAANDPYAGAEPPVESGQQFTRDPQGNIVPIQAQGTDVALQGLINEAKARGYDTSELEAQLHGGSAPAVEAPSNVAPPAAESLPAQRYDPTTDQWVDTRNAPPRTATSGNKVPVDWTSPAPAPEAAGAAALPNKPGITAETVQVAHERIDQALTAGTDKAEAAHAQLEQMLSDGAAPDEIARFLNGEVQGKKVSIPSIIRTVRTGSMAGGVMGSTAGENPILSGTAFKVAAGPLIQTAMRAPVAAVKALVTGHPGDIAAGLQGGLAGLAEGAGDALQTLRYGISYRAALTAGAQGGYGFTPGIDVMGKNVAQRALGTAAMGLVRTHGAIGDVSAGIGRGANLALGATPEAAAEAGQQWALRSGQYGTIGQTVASAIDNIKKQNPAMDVVGQILVPFYRVGYNVITQGVERSPIGLLGRITDRIGGKPFDTDKLANNLFGVGLASLGFAEAGQGNITGERPQRGSPKWSVRVAGQWVPLRVLGPAGEALAQSADLYEAARDGRGDVSKTATLTAEGYVSHVHDDTWLRSIGDALSFMNSYGQLGDPRLAAQAQREVNYVGGGYVQSMIPQEKLGSQVARAVGVKAPVFSLPGSSSSAPAPKRIAVRP